MTPIAPIKVAHLIVDLDRGGAEMMLLKLVEHTPRRDAESVVISMVEGGALRPQFEALGVPVHSLGMAYGKPTLSGVIRMRRLLRAARPLILQTWLYHANLLGLLAARPNGVPALAWNIRGTRIEGGHHSLITNLSVWLNERLAHLPEIVLFNSLSALRDYPLMAKRSRRAEAIPNGFDLSKFYPDPNARQAVRRELGLSDDHLVVGLMARYDPVKGHLNFIDAAQALAAQFPNARFVLAGLDVSFDNPALASRIAANGLQDRTTLLGPRDDIPRLMQALDALALSSTSEAFPNVIGEGMACGLPVVATDAGDARQIVGDAGFIVPPRDPRALAEGLARVLRLPPEQRRALGQRGRERVKSEYSIEQVAARYLALYQEMAAKVMAQSSGRGPGRQ